MVRLLKGDYEQMTVYGDDPLAVAADFEEKGAKFLHAVDLDGARDGETPAFAIVERIVRDTGCRWRSAAGSAVKRHIPLP